MKKIVFCCITLCVFQARSQSFLDDPFLYLFMGKRANEYAFSGNYPYNGYGYSRNIFQNPFSGMQLQDEFTYPGLFMNGKGNFSKYSYEPGNKNLYSAVSSDLSLVNGGSLTHAWGGDVLQRATISGAHRWKNSNENGLPEQPGRNDFNGAFRYLMSPVYKSMRLELNASRLSERTGLPAVPADSFPGFSNRFDLTQVSATAYFKLHAKGTDLWRKPEEEITVETQGQFIRHKAGFFDHAFDSDQRLFMCSIKYRNASREPRVNFQLGAEYRYLKTEETFDSVATVPLGGSLSGYVTAEKKLSPGKKIEAIYRADLLTSTGQWLHNPGLRYSYSPGYRSAFQLWSQLSHRYVNVIPEYLSYLTTGRNVYRNPVIRPDEFLRSGASADFKLADRFSCWISYQFDFYTLRNIADVITESETVNFYRVRLASYDHAIKAKLSWWGRYINALLMYQYTAAGVNTRNGSVQLPFYAPSSLLGTLVFRNKYKRDLPEAGISAFYASRFILGSDAQHNRIYSNPGFCLNVRTALPMSFISRKYKKLPHFVKRFKLMAGCDNVTAYRQTTLFSLADESRDYSSINTWGQYFGRRWFFGLFVNLDKKPRYDD